MSAIYDWSAMFVNLDRYDIWDKQEILLNIDHTSVEVMFGVPIAARSSKAEDKGYYVKSIIYGSFTSTVAYFFILL